MQQVFKDGSADDLSQFDDREKVHEALKKALADPNVESVQIHKPGSIVTIKNGPFKGRRYLVGDDGRLGKRVTEDE